MRTITSRVMVILPIKIRKQTPIDISLCPVNDRGERKGSQDFMSKDEEDPRRSSNYIERSTNDKTDCQ